MAIKINGNTVITDARKGEFEVLNVGSLALEPTTDLLEGDFYWDSDQQILRLYNSYGWS